jgi:surfeit locus 1 family protein
MARRNVVFLVLSVLVALGCVRLGFWQLSRHRERASRNALVEARLREAEVDVRQLPRDTAALRFRRATVTGEPLHDREFVLAARVHRGSPGVHIVTPVRIAGTDSLLIVVRGWAYSPDGATVDLSRWREWEGPVSVSGFVEPIPDVPSAVVTGRERTLRRLHRADVERLAGGPVLPFYLVLGSPAAPGAGDRLARVEPPALAQGSHFSYAMQWFSFAVIALVGGVRVTRRTVRDGATRDTAERSVRSMRQG